MSTTVALPLPTAPPRLSERRATRRITVTLVEEAMKPSKRPGTATTEETS